jgi:hypothetical protein
MQDNSSSLLTLVTNRLVLIIGIGFLVLIIIASIVQNSKPQKAPANQPTVMPNDQRTITPHDNPPVENNVQQTKKMIDLIDHRQPLSAADQQVKNKIITQPNPLKVSKDFSAEYLSAPDEFMVEIRSMNLNKAKEEATAWFKSQGLSDAGICHLPVVFYINYDIAQSLRGMKIQFDPLPPGC